MFPESFAERWIDEYSRPNDVILDPFCGRGTTPFQALLMGRRAIATDTNPVAFCVTKAKTAAPSLASVRRRITQLERGFAPARQGSSQDLPEFFSYAFHPSTLSQLLYLRGRLKWAESALDAMVAALVLGALHGESSGQPRYLSNQMPRTISTKPAYSVRFWVERGHFAPDRDVFAVLRNAATFRYASEPPAGDALVVNADMRELWRYERRFPAQPNCVVTSPPYLDVTNFEEDQWLRLWFLGGPHQPTRGRLSKDDRHYSRDPYWRLISDMWRILGRVLAPRSHVVVRIGEKGVDPDALCKALVGSAVASGRKAVVHTVEVSEIRRRQTDAFRPGAAGCRYELDLALRLR